MTAFSLVMLGKLVFRVCFFGVFCCCCVFTFESSVLSLFLINFFNIYFVSFTSSNVY